MVLGIITGHCTMGAHAKPIGLKYLASVGFEELSCSHFGYMPIW